MAKVMLASLTRSVPQISRHKISRSQTNNERLIGSELAEALETLMAIATGIFSIVVLGYLTIVGFLYFNQERMVFFPDRYLVAAPDSVGLEYEDVTLTAADGVRINGWYVPAAGNSSDGESRVMLHLHGNGGNISHRLETIAQVHRMGLHILIIDYRQYGRSQGQVTEAGTYLDAEAAWRYLVVDKGFTAEQIIIAGHSLGGAVAAALAEKHPPRALILESTFTSIPDMGARQYPWLPVRQLARVQYNTAARLANIHVPLIVIHSPDDEVVPYSHGQALFELANEPKEFLQINGGHGDGFLVSAEEYEAIVGEFVWR
jgi:pimeloyl-ACP methyl ester carboxylesterase